MTHTFDSEVSLHSLLLWPTVRQCIGENKGLNQIHAADWNPTHNCRQPYNQEKILSLAILINIFL